MKAVRGKKWNYSGERFVKEVGFKPTVNFTVGLKPTSFTNLSLLCGYILRLPTEGWPGWVDLDDGLNRPNRDSLLAGLYVFRPIFCSISNMDALLLWKTNRNSYALFESNGAIFSDLEWRLSSPNHLIFLKLCVAFHVFVTKTSCFVDGLTVASPGHDDKSQTTRDPLYSILGPQSYLCKAPSTPTMSKHDFVSKAATMSNKFIVKCRPFDKVETNWTCSCFHFVKMTKFRSTLLPKMATLLQKNGKSVETTFEFVERIIQLAEFDMLLRHCCCCGRGLTGETIGTVNLVCRSILMITNA